MLCSFYPSPYVAGVSPLVHPQTQVVQLQARLSFRGVPPMLAAVAAELSKVVADPSRVLTAPAVLDRLSHDFYWYSPVLRPLLVDKIAEVAVQPISVDE